MKHLSFFLLILAAMAFIGCDTAVSVFISNPAGGTSVNPKQLAPGEKLSILVNENADIGTFKVTIHDPNTSDDACPYFLPVDITQMFAPLATGTTLTAPVPGRMSVCGPFKVTAQAQFATPPSAKTIITSSETWIIPYEIRQVPPANDFKIKVNETIEVGVDFVKPAIDDFEVRAKVSHEDIPIVMVNNSLPEATVKVAKGESSVRFQIKGVTKGQCFLWVDLLGGPDYAKTITVE